MIIDAIGAIATGLGNTVTGGANIYTIASGDSSKNRDTALKLSEQKSNTALEQTKIAAAALAEKEKTKKVIVVVLVIAILVFIITRKR